jgi:hypothetical protein
MNQKLVRNGLVAAGLMNIGGVLLFSRGFTNTAINDADPVVMSNFGLLMIIIWGLAFIGAATSTSSIRWLAAVFAVEKLIYVLVWMRWMSENSLTSLYSTDFLAGVFYSIYGLNDFMFLLFFAWLFASSKQIGKT